MSMLIDQIAEGHFYDSNAVLGYSNAELQQIERLYDVSLTGIFRQFLFELGRSDGGLIGDDPIILYRPTWDVRTQILHQVTFFNDMQDSGHFSFLREQPFTFSCENETQHFFIRTSSEAEDLVYHYDENSRVVRNTELNFLEYMQQTVKTYGGKEVSCRGELLII